MQIETDALIAASVGPNRPPPDRLRAVAEHVAENTGAEQLILFGSAARGGFTEHSDFDFLVVRPANGTRIDSREKWTQPETGDEIDVLCVDAATLEEHRWSAGKVHCSILLNGATIGTTRKQGRYAVTCKLPGESAERLLKALAIAQGEPVVFTHDLREIWERIEARGENIEAEKNDRLLNEVSLYGSDRGCGTPSGEDPKRLVEMFKPIVNDLMAHAKRRVPELAAEHGRPSAREGGAPPRRPSAKAAADGSADRRRRRTEIRSAGRLRRPALTTRRPYRQDRDHALLPDPSGPRRPGRPQPPAGW